jgi:hypothetical protein
MFDTSIKYYFNGSCDLVENAKTEKYLGNFVEYVDFVCGSDWLHDAKARFEYGVISKGHYDKVTKVENDSIYSNFEYIYNNLLGIKEKNT